MQMNKANQKSLGQLNVKSYRFKSKEKNLISSKTNDDIVNFENRNPEIFKNSKTSFQEF